MDWKKIANVTTYVLFLLVLVVGGWYFAFQLGRSKKDKAEVYEPPKVRRDYENMLLLETPEKIGVSTDIGAYTYDWSTNTWYQSGRVYEETRHRECVYPFNIYDPTQVTESQDGKTYDARYDTLAEFIAEGITGGAEHEEYVMYKGDSVSIVISTADLTYCDGYPDDTGAWRGWLMENDTGEMVDGEWSWRAFRSSEFSENNNMLITEFDDVVVCDFGYYKMMDRMSNKLQNLLEEKIKDSEIRILDGHVVYDFSTVDTKVHGVCLCGDVWRGTVWGKERTGIFEWSADGSTIYWLPDT